MTWPNLITLARLFSAPVIVWLILTDNYIAAFWITIGAGFSDILDGLLARLLKTPSKLGAYLDPCADKILLISIFITLGIQKLIPLWVIIVVVFRDLLILGGVGLLWGMRKKVIIRPLTISKINTFFQIFSSTFVLAHHAYGLGSQRFIETLFIITVATTVLSAAGYGGALRNLVKGTDGAY